MINIKLLRKNNNLNRIIIKGHAMYDDYGKDIVCAAVSSTVMTSVESIASIESIIDISSIII